MKQEHDLTEAKLAENENVKLLISQTTELNDRQKRIMQWEGVTTDYSQMNDEQKEAAIKIEMLYHYLDEKYPGKEFEYKNFLLYPIGADLIVKETSDKKHREVSVSLEWDNKEKKYKYSDYYYLAVLASDEYEKLIKEHIKESDPNANFFLDVEIQHVDNETEKIAIDNADGSITIVMENKFASKDEAESYLQEFDDWLIANNNNHGGIIRLIVVDSNTFESAKFSNRVTSNLLESKIIYDIFSEIMENDELRFW
ncbi:hypothetical protein [Pseudobutyrivibrio sp. YE44]|uniref:hypothetical protein n=1 Tax=Pseudobutyrivibrio sp. YE44 TaxID=1520802 RepID=UPI00115F91A0|nr:hypothetical protein [Pseudobutyrivibrio sp. YE44]